MCDQEYKAGVVYLDNAATTRMAEEADCVAELMKMYQKLTEEK